MHRAVCVLSRKGILVEEIDAYSVRSREHARKLWPLVTTEKPHRLVTWVRASFHTDGKLRAKSHFRRLSDSSDRKGDAGAWIKQQEEKRCKRGGEGDRHKKAKRMLTSEIERRLSRGLGLSWSYSDPNLSDYPFSGDLTVGVERVVQEHTYQPLTGIQYRLDVALLGPAIENRPMIMGGLEIEDSHSFDGLKGLISKFQAFPIISIDISGMNESDITEDWAARILSKTTAGDQRGFRKTYVYIPDVLYPLFWQYPEDLADEKQQLLVFGSDADLTKLKGWMSRLAKKLNMGPTSIQAGIHRRTNQASQKALETAGAISGHDWQALNPDKFLRVVLARPRHENQVATYRLYLTIARMLVSTCSVSVGYQYEPLLRNEDPEQDIWLDAKWSSGNKTIRRFLPKRIADPRDQILDAVERFL